MINKKILIPAIVLTFIVFLVAIVYTTVNRASQPISFNMSKAIAGNIQYPAMINGSMHFFTGSNFASYDVTANTTAQTSRILRLPNVEGIQWADGAAVLEANNYSAIDELYPILTAKQLLLDRNYLWLWRKDSPAFTLLESPTTGSPAKMAVWEKGGQQSNLIFITDRVGDEEYSATFFRMTPRGNTSAIGSYTGKQITSLKWADDTGAIAETFDRPSGKSSLTKLTFGEEVTSKLLEDNLMPGSVVSEDGKSFGFYRTQKKPDNHLIGKAELFVKFEQDRARLVASGYSGVSSWDQQSQSFVSHGETEGKYRTYVVGRNKTKTYAQEKKEDLETNPDMAKMFVKSSSPLSLFVIDVDNDLYAIDEEEDRSYPEKKDPANLQGDYYGDGFSINYMPKTNSFNIYITRNPFSANQKKAYEFIKGRGFDPNQLNIKVYVYDRVDFRT